MAPKKKTFNGFSVFMMETQQTLAKQGIKMSMADMPAYCTKDWEMMPDQIKEKYKAKGKQMKNDTKIGKYTSIGEKVEDVQKQSEDSKLQTIAMYSYIEELVRMHPASYYLPKHKFILIHVNPYTCEKEQFYFPAEISMAEFSLEKGLIRIFHQLVGFDKIRTKAPPAPTADINNHAKNYHQIDSYSKLPNNYTDILLKIIGFIMDKEVDKAVLNDSTLDLPPVYTAHTSTGNELMITTSSLYQLYQSAVKNAYKDDFNNLLRIYHLDKLFMELKNVSYKIKSGNSESALPSVAMATENLSKDMFNTIKSIGCSFHEKLENGHVCSNYYVCKWIYIMSTHCCQFFDVKLVPGSHFDFDLSKTEYNIEENIDNLCISNSDNMADYFQEKKPKDLTANSFPALDGGLSTFIQQPVWSRPEQKSLTPSKTLPNKSNNFPPLGNSKEIILDNASSVSSWRNNAGRGRGIINQVQNNNPTFSSDNIKKPTRGRGFHIDRNK